MTKKSLKLFPHINQNLTLTLSKIFYYTELEIMQLQISTKKLLKDGAVRNHLLVNGSKESFYWRQSA